MKSQKDGQVIYSRHRRNENSAGVSTDGVPVLEVDADGEVITGFIVADRPATWNRKAFARNLAEAREAMPMGRSVMDEVRRSGRY
jgi:hypothetical protein